MKKGCLIAVAVTFGLVAVVLAIAVYVSNKKMGYLEARPVSHEEVAPKFTRFRLAVNPEKLADYAERMLGEDIDNLPRWLPMKPNDLAHKLMPFEVAVMCSADYQAGHIDVRLFLNERRGGPMMPGLARQKGVLENIPGVKWDEAGLRFERRGVLTADGTLPIPAGLDTRVRLDWNVTAGEEALRLEGGHLAEVVLDNRNGEAVLMLGALMDQRQGTTWKKEFATPNMKVLLDLLKEVNVIRLQADLASIDAIRLKLRIEAEPEAAPSFNNMSMLLPLVSEGLELRFKLKLEGKGEWDEAEGAFIGNFRLSGLSRFFDPASVGH